MGICYMKQGAQSVGALWAEGWDTVGDGREVQKGGDICIPTADSCWGLTENDKTL